MNHEQTIAAMSREEVNLILLEIVKTMHQSDYDHVGSLIENILIEHGLYSE